MKKSALICLLAAAFGSQALASCTEVGIVGGRCGQTQVELDGDCFDECPDELTACNQQCVDLGSNEEHCGSCGNACAVHEACIDSECVDNGTGGSTGNGGSAGHGGSSGNGGSATTAGTAGVGEGGTEAGVGGGAGEGQGGSAGQSGGTAGQGGSGMPPVCGPPFNTPDKCGSCEVQCPDTEPVCSPVGGGYECVAACEPTADLCQGACTDTEVDPDNCGQCGKVCESGYCYMGMCIGAHYGHVVLMCIDYAETARSSPTQWLLGNSVFLPANSFARVLAFTGYTPAVLRDNVDLTLSWAAGEVGQLYSLAHEDNPASLPAQLTVDNFDTLLVYNQPGATSGQLTALGTSWKAAIDDFVQEGGAVVVLSGGAMKEFITAAGLLNVTAETAVTNVPLFNRAPTDSVGLNVLTPFQSRANTCRFTTATPQSAALSYVITGNPFPQAPVDPVVLHRILFTDL